MRPNEEIRSAAKKNGVKLWEIAESLQITDSNFSRKLRHELTESEKASIMIFIYEKAGKNAKKS